MNLTSYNHIRHFLSRDTKLSYSSLQDRRSFANLIPMVSRSIEKFCNRFFEKKDVIQYLETLPNKKTYFVEYVPINTLTSVQSDSTGLFQGSITNENDYFILPKGEGVVLSTPVPECKKGLKLTYNGGLAWHPTNCKLILNPGHGTFVQGKFVTGNSSLAYGQVISLSGNVLTLDIYYGLFEEGEILTQYDSEEVITSPSITGSISSFSEKALCQVAPDLVQACEIEVRFLHTHKNDFENMGTNKDGTTLRRINEKDYTFQQEALNIIKHYVIMDNF